MTAKVHPTASVNGPLTLGRNSRVGPGVKLFGSVKVMDSVLLDSSCMIYGPAEIGKGTYVGPNAVIGFPTRENIGRNLNRRGGWKVMRGGGVAVGHGCVVRSGCTIYENVEVAEDVKFGHNVVIREGVKIGRGSIIGTNVVVDGHSRIGRRVSIQTGAYICTYSTVEDGVFLGPYCVFTNDRFAMQKKTRLVGPTVKRGASIGANAVLMPEITVGEGAVIGAQAVVSTNVEPRAVYVGVPARKLKEVPANWHSLLLR